MTEEQKRLHRCCFSGHRPEKLNEDPETVKAWLLEKIDQAIADGYRTFICGCGMGVDLWAGRIVLQKKQQDPSLHLIAAPPWPGFAGKWSIDWHIQYSNLMRHADLVVPVSEHYHNGVFQKRNEWMVDHSNRVIAYYNGAPGGTENTIDYALSKGIEVVSNNPDYRPREKKRKQMKSEKMPYPENLLRDIGLEKVFGKPEYTPLNEDQTAGLAHALTTIREREQEMIRLRYEEKKTLQEIGDQYELSRERVRQIIAKGVRKLRHPSRTVYVRDGYGKAELAQKIACADEIKKQLTAQKKRYPLMTEADVVKFVFQGMLGVGHLIRSAEEAKDRLSAEMETLHPDADEPLIEKISTDWVRLNLRPAMAQGMTADEIAWYLVRSAEWGALSFTRQNVYNFCVKIDGSERMRAAAARALDEQWLPGHSEQYREAYHPAYRVLHKDFRKFGQSHKLMKLASDRGDNANDA